MRFFNLFTAILPAIVLAVPGPSALPHDAALENALRERLVALITARDAQPLEGRAPTPLAEASAALDSVARMESRMESRMNELAARQLDLGGLENFLANLTASFSALEALLSVQSLNNIESVVTNLAYVLDDPTSKQLKDVVNVADGLLTSPAITNLTSELPSLLSAISPLLKDLPTLIGSVSGLLTPALITNVTDILSGAHSLLTPTFVSETTELINDVAPLVSAIAQVISALLSAVFGTSA